MDIDKHLIDYFKCGNLQLHFHSNTLKNQIQLKTPKISQVNPHLVNSCQNLSDKTFR